MKRRTISILAMAILGCWPGWAFAQDKALKVAVMNISEAIVRSNDGQEALKQIQTRFAPKEADLQRQQREIADLQNQLRQQERTLSPEALARLQRSVDEKTRVLNRAAEDAQAEFQQAQQDVGAEISRKMMGVIEEYIRTSGFTLVLDASQSPILYAEPSIVITDKIVELYNQATAKPATGAAPAPAAQPGAAAPRPATPPASTTAPAPAAPRPAAPPSAPPASNP
ncbi:MAG: OmpH family outer membrane protein [Terriglobia bacterium]